MPAWLLLGALWSLWLWWFAATRYRPRHACPGRLAQWHSDEQDWPLFEHVCSHEDVHGAY